VPTLGTSSGFRVYTTEPFAKCHQTYEGSISLMEMLFSTSLIALVLSPRRLVITNTKVQPLLLCGLELPTDVRGRGTPQSASSHSQLRSLASSWTENDWLSYLKTRSTFTISVIWNWFIRSTHRRIRKVCA